VCLPVGWARPAVGGISRRANARLYYPVLGGPRPAARACGWQALKAAMTVGEFLEMSAGGFMSPVVGLGSGKFGTPWARMQRDTARSFCISRGLT
jgi:hypothetical protein